MSSEYLFPQFGNMQNMGQNPSPWFTIANQFLPRNLHDVIRWSRYITTQSPTTTEVIRKMASYPITSFKVDSSNTHTVEKYQSIFKLLKLRQTLQEIGFAYHTLGNVFISIHFPIHRSLVCPSCATSYSARKADFVTFKKGKFQGTCPHCQAQVDFKRFDLKSTNTREMNVIRWDPINITVNHNPITGQSDYYYSIPNEVRRKIIAGDMLYLSTTPWSFIEAALQNKDYKFDNSKIYHMKAPSLATVDLNGIAVPPLISLFGLIFYQATLRKANESIAAEYMTPLRVVYPGSTGSDPAVAMSLGNFKSRMEQAISKHKRDRNHVLVAPVPVGYGTISGEGKALLVNAEIREAEETMLLSLGVSRELLSGTTNWTSSTVGLRLMQSSMDSYVGQMNELLEWLGTQMADYIGLEQAGVALEEFKLIDDTVMQQLWANLAAQDKVSMSGLFEVLGMDYQKELERKKQDHIDQQVAEVEAAIESKKARVTAAMRLSADADESTSEYVEFVQQCLLEAEDLVGQPPEMVQLVMAKLEVEDPAKALVISELIANMQAVAEPAPEDSAGGPNGPPTKAPSAGKKPSPSKD